MAAKASEAGKWSSVGSALYRKLELYSLQWQDSVGSTLQLDRCKKVACAAYGGPVALWRESATDFSSTRTAHGSRSQIETFTAAGQRLGTVKRIGDNLLDISWSYDEQLLCIYLDGRVSVEDMYGNCMKNISFGSDVEQAGVAECRFFINNKNNTGIIVLTNTAKFYLIKNIDDPRTFHINTENVLLARPSCWCLIPNLPGVGHVLFAASEENVFKFEITNGTSQQVTLPWDRPSPLRDIVASPDRSRIAFLTASYGIIMTGADMKHVLCLFDKHKYKSPPRQFVWCGNSAVAAYWHDHKLLQLVAPPAATAATETHAVTDLLSSQLAKCSTLVFKFNTTQYLCTELDGLRSVSQFQHEFLQEVPRALADLFKYGTTAPSATLLEAYSAFEERQHQADEYLRLVMDKLEDAVSACIRGAPYADEPLQQKRILRTAAFGKAFIDEQTPKREFYRMCQLIRVLNAVRSPLVGMPLSYDQLEALTPPALITRLVARRQFPLAIEIANFLELPPEQGSSSVLINWALYKVRQQSIPNEQVAASIIEKLSNVPGVSFFDVAECALQAGRHDVAGRLLEHEPNPYKQVKLLLRLERSDIAIRKAMESLDPALMYEVVQHMRHGKSTRQVDFYLNLTRNYPMACLVYKAILQEHETGRRELLLRDDAVNKPNTTTGRKRDAVQFVPAPGAELRDCYAQDDSHYKEALCRIRDAYAVSGDLQERMSELQQASASIARGGGGTRGSSSRDLLKTLCDEQRRLWKDQRGLEEKFSTQAFVDLSLHDYLRAVIRLRQYKVADDIKKDYHVSDRVYWYIKIDELANSNSPDWDEFDRLSSKKSGGKSPLEEGNMPLFEACMKYGHHLQATKQLAKLTDEQRIDGHVMLGQFEQAAEFAFQKKDLRGLEIISDKCPRNNRDLAQKITGYRNQLG